MENKNKKKCSHCGSVFRRPFRVGRNVYVSLTMWDKRKFCSIKCFGKEKTKHYICIVCGKNYFRPIRNKFFCSSDCQGVYFSNKNNSQWKGESATYTAKHAWVIRKMGSAKKRACVDCGKQAKNWSNVDHTYKRKLGDYQPRCVRCHRKNDYSMSKLA